MDAKQESISINSFRKLVVTHCGDLNSIDKQRQHDICKLFYKKLPPDNKFADNFMAITNERSKKKGKKLDNIQSMLNRLSVCLGDSRRTVEDGQNMGGINYTFLTKLTPDETSVGPEIGRAHV